ncbi:procollagen C-endopeptidase enhancer 1-like [Branchiostoma floridae x Branchiostoma belcheri]
MNRALLIVLCAAFSVVGVSEARCSRSRPKSCGRTVSAYRGWIKSPGFPRPYPSAMTEDDRVCTWTIRLPQSRGIKITLYGFDLNFEQTGVGPTNDALHIYMDESCSSLLRSYEGNFTDADLIHIPSNTACIKFLRRTQQNYQHNGFSLGYEAVDSSDDCDNNQTTTLVSDEGYIYSPGYPVTSYQQELNCSWHIQARPDQTVQITFLDFQLSYTFSCDFATDYVQVFELNSSMNLKYCDQDSPAPFSSYSNNVWVVFKSGRWRNKGFWLHYKANTDGVLSDEPIPDYRQIVDEWRNSNSALMPYEGRERGARPWQSYTESKGHFVAMPLCLVTPLVVTAVWTARL